MSGYMAELEDLISASHISTSMDMHKTEGGSTLTGPFNKPENALPKKDSNTVHARASLLADHFTIHKTADAAPQARSDPPKPPAVLRLLVSGSIRVSQVSQPTPYCCSQHAQEMASRTSPATTGNSGPSAIAGACHTRSAALSHFPALSADSGILTEGGMASGDISNADVIADDVVRSADLDWLKWSFMIADGLARWAQAQVPHCIDVGMTARGCRQSEGCLLLQVRASAGSPFHDGNGCAQRDRAPFPLHVPQFCWALQKTR